MLTPQVELEQREWAEGKSWIGKSCWVSRHTWGEHQVLNGARLPRGARHSVYVVHHEILLNILKTWSALPKKHSSQRRAADAEGVSCTWDVWWSRGEDQAKPSRSQANVVARNGPSPRELLGEHVYLQLDNIDEPPLEAPEGLQSRLNGISQMMILIFCLEDYRADALKDHGIMLKVKTGPRLLTRCCGRSFEHYFDIDGNVVNQNHICGGGGGGGRWIQHFWCSNRNPLRSYYQAARS